MIWKLLEPSDYPVLKPFFQRPPYNLSIYSLLSLIAWNTGPIRSRYLFDRNCLFISSEMEANPDERYLILPLYEGAPWTPEELHGLASDFGYRHYRFVPGDYLALTAIEKWEKCFLISEQTAFEDYVYRKDDLVHLKGNRYARKRNLIHQFTRDYNRKGLVALDSMNPANRDECLLFMEEWCRQRHCDQDESLACEKRALSQVLRHIEILDPAGIVVRIGGVVSALAIVSHLNEKMGVLHFEKAFSNIRGLYQFLDQECAKRLFLPYEFVNKESDMNVAELAQSKKSYHPVGRIKSYCLTLR